MKSLLPVLLIVGLFATACAAEEADTPKTLVLDDLEGEIASVTADKTEKHSGAQSLRIDGAAESGVLFRKAVPETIAWESYGAISFWMKGTGSGASIAFDLEDAAGGLFRFTVKDDTPGWRQVLCPFDQFLPRGNGVLTFPVRAFRFETIATASGTIYIDDISLEPLN